MTTTTDAQELLDELRDEEASTQALLTAELPARTRKQADAGLRNVQRYINALSALLAERDGYVSVPVSLVSTCYGLLKQCDLRLPIAGGWDDFDEEMHLAICQLRQFLPPPPNPNPAESPVTVKEPK